MDTNDVMDANLSHSFRTLEFKDRFDSESRDPQVIREAFVHWWFIARFRTVRDPSTGW